MALMCTFHLFRRANGWPLCAPSTFSSKFCTTLKKIGAAPKGHPFAPLTRIILFGRGVPTSSSRQLVYHALVCSRGVQTVKRGTRSQISGVECSCMCSCFPTPAAVEGQELYACVSIYCGLDFPPVLPSASSFYVSRRERERERERVDSHYRPFLSVNIIKINGWTSISYTHDDNNHQIPHIPLEL